MIKLTTPISKDTVKTLKAGDEVLLSGTVYTARDAAHKRLSEALSNGDKLPINLKTSVIYYAGPCPAKPGEIIGACGPTTSGRVDAYTPLLLDLGLSLMIGKGLRSDAVIESMKKNTAVYMAAIGGAGALIAEKVSSAEIVAYEDLGTEAIRKLEVKDLPLTVVIDSFGNNLYEIGREKFKEKL